MLHRRQKISQRMEWCNHQRMHTAFGKAAGLGWATCPQSFDRSCYNHRTLITKKNFSLRENHNNSACDSGDNCQNLVMVEPLSLIGLVSNIAQFTEYALELLSDAKSVYRTGQTIGCLEVIELSKAIERMNFLMQKVEDSYTKSVNSNTHDAETQIEMDLLQRYRSISADLRFILEELEFNSGRNRAVECVRVILKAYRKKAEVETLRRKLESLLTDVQSRNVCLIM